MESGKKDVCGCGGSGTCQTGSTNKPLYELKHLIAMLERDEEAKRQREERKMGNVAA
jgi:hypothetical protein